MAQSGTESRKRPFSVGNDAAFSLVKPTPFGQISSLAHNFCTLVLLRTDVVCRGPVRALLKVGARASKPISERPNASLAPKHCFSSSKKIGSSC